MRWNWVSSGTWQWSVVPISGDGRFTGVTGVGSRVFVVGTVSPGALGGSDAVVVEIDPTDGTALDTIWLGGGENDGAIGVVAASGVLWVAGATRSFATPDGNEIGELDVAVWRVPVG